MLGGFFCCFVLFGVFIWLVLGFFLVCFFVVVVVVWLCFGFVGFFFCLFVFLTGRIYLPAGNT